MCVCVCDIVIIVIYSYDKWLYTLVASLSLIPPKCAKTREPEDEHCVLWCIPIYTQPLDNSKT